MSSDDDSESEMSVSSHTSHASSEDSLNAAGSSLRHRGFAGVGGLRAEPVELTKLRLQREQRLRRVLSQRHLGQPETIPHNAFFCTRSALSEEDVVWLSSLTNADCFERLVTAVQAAPSPLAGQLDTVLASANPLFHFLLRMDIAAAAPPSPTSASSSSGTACLAESPLMQRWREQTAPLRRRRCTSEELSEAPSQGRGRGLAQLDDASTRKAAKTASSASASSGLVAQSMMAWEAHLAASLSHEGETIENFRQARAKTSYMDKKSFQQQAEWNEFQREVALQQQQRDREATRALRRGEEKD